MSDNIDVVYKKTIWWYVFRFAFFFDLVSLMKRIKSKKIILYYIKGSNKIMDITTVSSIMQTMITHFPDLVPHKWKDGKRLENMG